MGFGNVGLLLGALLGVVPIVIHLINRRRAKLVRFAAMEFLLLSDKRLARRLKLKQILILALRVLLIVALAVALAKPYLEPEQTAQATLSEPGAVVLVLDDSASMEALDEEGTSRLERAVARARQLIAAGGPRTSFGVVTMGKPARLLTPGLTFDRGVAARALGQVQAGGRAADLAGALGEAGRILSESGEQQRTVVLLSDLAAHAMAPLASGWSWVPVTQVEQELLDPAMEAGRVVPNVAVLEVATGAVGAPDTAGEVMVEASVTIGNFGEAEVEVPVRLKLGSATAAERVRVAAGGQVSVAFKVKVAAGTTDGEVVVEAAADNRLAADDSFYFTVGSRPRLQVLLVNGSPQAVAWRDEVFFLRAALAVPAPGEAPLAVSVVQSSELGAGRVDAADVVVLANVGQLTAAQQLALVNFVERGGGLFLTAGDRWGAASESESQERVDERGIAALNAAYGKLFPMPVRELKSVGDTSDPKVRLAAPGLGTLDFDHPVLSIFGGLDDVSLLKAHVASYALVDAAGAADGAKVLASLSGGVPALVEGRLGRGRILMLTTSVDHDWADLALKTSFPPLMQRIVGYLARSLEGGARVGLTVGEAARVVAPEGQGPLRLVRPDGVEAALDAGEGGDGSGAGETPVGAGGAGEPVYVGVPDVAGHWALMRAGEPERAQHFAVNVARSESDLRPAGADVVGEVVAQITRDNGVLPSAAGSGEPSVDVSEVPGRTVLWPWILASLFLLFGGEAWLLVRGT